MEQLNSLIILNNFYLWKIQSLTNIMFEDIHEYPVTYCSEPKHFRYFKFWKIFALSMRSIETGAKCSSSILIFKN